MSENGRHSGVLLHISSLPGAYGIGTMGENARRFTDLLSENGQSVWQILPLNPTSVGDSPYQSISSRAGNPYFIDLSTLQAEGWLSKGELDSLKFSEKDTEIDYRRLYLSRGKAFPKIFENFKARTPDDFHLFIEKNDDWLRDFSLFAAIKESFSGLPFYLWPTDLKYRKRDALKAAEKGLADRIFYHQMLQYFFFMQWESLSQYAERRRVKIIGDVPIYVSSDSVEVWCEPRQFEVNKALTPRVVAGCPPDPFSPEGQCWGNPVYDWEYMKNDGFSWWKRRLEFNLRLFSGLRLDHFRGFSQYFSIQKGKAARTGRWNDGGGKEFIDAIKPLLKGRTVIAEDLGFVTDDVRELLKHSGFFGTKVLQFGFDPREESCYLPHLYTKDTAVYTGTHDTETLVGWVEGLGKDELKFCMEYLGQNEKSKLAKALLRAAMSSVSRLCITPMQDLLYLGKGARMNTPSSVGDNWKWRMTPHELTPESFEEIAKFAEIYGRNNFHE